MLVLCQKVKNCIFEHIIYKIFPVTGPLWISLAPMPPPKWRCYRTIPVYSSPVGQRICTIDTVTSLHPMYGRRRVVYESVGYYVTKDCASSGMDSRDEPIATAMCNSVRSISLIYLGTKRVPAAWPSAHVESL